MVVSCGDGMDLFLGRMRWDGMGKADGMGWDGMGYLHAEKFSRKWIRMA